MGQAPLDSIQNRMRYHNGSGPIGQYVIPTIYDPQPPDPRSKVARHLVSKLYKPHNFRCRTKLKHLMTKHNGSGPIEQYMIPTIHNPRSTTPDPRWPDTLCLNCANLTIYDVALT